MIQKLLTKLDACENACKWAGKKSWKEIFETCHRGDWLLWLYKATNHEDLRKLTLAKAHCANTVRHLMKDDRSIAAIDVAIRFGNGEATEDELRTAAVAAFAAVDTDVAAYAAVAAAAAVDTDVAAVAVAAAFAAYAAYSVTARKINQQQTADICRKYLPFEIWNIEEDIK